MLCRSFVLGLWGIYLSLPICPSLCMLLAVRQISGRSPALTASRRGCNETEHRKHAVLPVEGRVKASTRQGLLTTPLPQVAQPSPSMSAMMQLADRQAPGVSEGCLAPRPGPRFSFQNHQIPRRDFRHGDLCLQRYAHACPVCHGGESPAQCLDVTWGRLNGGDRDRIRETSRYQGGSHILGGP